MTVCQYITSAGLRRALLLIVESRISAFHIGHLLPVAGCLAGCRCREDYVPGIFSGMQVLGRQEGPRGIPCCLRYIYPKYSCRGAELVSGQAELADKTTRRDVPRCILHPILFIYIKIFLFQSDKKMEKGGGEGERVYLIERNSKLSGLMIYARQESDPCLD